MAVALLPSPPSLGDGTAVADLMTRCHEKDVAFPLEPAPDLRKTNIMKIACITLTTVGLLACMVVAHAATASSEGRANEATEALMVTDRRLIVDFSKKSFPSGWEIEDDVVMGGRSKGGFTINDDGHAVFSGDVSLENNGGFSSVQYYFDPVDVSPYRTVCLRVKGDGKTYQFLVEADRGARHYYVYEFQTGHAWQTIEVPLADMVAAYRGDRLRIPNFSAQTIAMVRFLIGNKKAESFRLEIDAIWLQ